MRVLIVAKTRRGGGACVGGITWKGQSVRLVAADAQASERAGLEYGVGEIWDIVSSPAPAIVPPHVENVLVHAARRTGLMPHPEEFIAQQMPAAVGGFQVLFDGLIQSSPTGALYLCERTGLPARSTMFWQPDQPLQIDVEGKRIRYRYPSPDGGRTLTFVGFQEPLPQIPAGTLLRVSLAHAWRPKDHPEDELRCYVQLSGWFVKAPTRSGTAEKSELGQPRNRPQRIAPTPSIEAARQALKRHFGFTDFLPTQREVIHRILNRLDTLAVMPTGGGKSLCYQLPALLFEGLTVVVSPLIALMQDQVTQLHELRIPAAFLNCTVSHQEYLRRAAAIRNRAIRIVYAAPETLLRPETLLLLEQSGLSCLAVDEAHCISDWGHDFRPEYRQLETLRQRFSSAVCLALTATATPRVRDDIRCILGISPGGDFVASFDRPNLLLHVRPRQDAFRQCLAFLEEHRNQSGIIYCATRAQVDKLVTELTASGWPARAYHAGLDDTVRRKNQEQFIHDDAALMVATVAFGMGINKSNVRFVLHYHLPKNLESYYQEIGRAGRDGLPAHCLLLHDRADAITIRRFIHQGAQAERPGRDARLEAMIRYAEFKGCRSVPLLGYFGETIHPPCGHCDGCLAARDLAQSAKRAASVHNERALFDHLRALRRSLAQAAHVPAYIVFSDRALLEMAARGPQTEIEFLAINGVGEVKLAKYGPAFLQAIADFGARR